MNNFIMIDAGNKTYAMRTQLTKRTPNLVKAFTIAICDYLKKPQALVDRCLNDANTMADMKRVMYFATITKCNTGKVSYYKVVSASGNMQMSIPEEEYKDCIIEVY